MIYILHGDDQFASRNQFNLLLQQNQAADVFKVDSKSIDLDQINNFINGQSLFINQKLLTISNFFSIPKAILDKLTKIIKTNPQLDLVIWQDKSLNATQLKTFPNPQIQNFPLDKIMFSCINNLRPKNTAKFISLFHQVIEKEPFELFLFWLRFNLRKQLTSFSKFDSVSLKKAYLQIIELDFQNKTGQLAIPKELALERILINLMK